MATLYYDHYENVPKFILIMLFTWFWKLIPKRISHNVVIYIIYLNNENEYLMCCHPTFVKER